MIYGVTYRCFESSCNCSKIFRASLVERMAYRGDFLIGTVLRFLPMVTTILLWEAVYTGAAQGGEKKTNPLNGQEYVTKDKPAYNKVSILAVKSLKEALK